MLTPEMSWWISGAFSLLGWSIILVSLLQMRRAHRDWAKHNVPKLIEFNLNVGRKS